MAARWLLLAWLHYLVRVRRLSMNDWLQATPFLVFVFLAAVIVIPALIKRRIARNRIVKPYVGETIPHKEDS